MSRYYSYINTARSILEQYKGEEPFATFSKKFFSLHKKYGSRDRKMISHLCYCFFRMGWMGRDMPVEQRILTAVFLCADQPNEFLQELAPDWNALATISIPEKLAIADPSLKLADVFPWKDQLSDGIDHEQFCESFFIQPDVFLRLRGEGYGAFVPDKLLKSVIPFCQINDTCISLAPGSNIEKVLTIDYEAMIQDLNSQETGRFFEEAIGKSSLPFISAWDCCAGSGGKSLMLFDLYKQLDLVVSDKRESIIKNLEKRFATHGVKNYQAFVTDVTKPLPKNIAQNKFDIIICDAPCSGSGTWSRTPEQLYFFDPGAIQKFSSLQRSIVSNIIPRLQDGGSLVYITCSVFKSENEDILKAIQENGLPAPKNAEVLKGYDKKADTMFAALFQRSS